MTILSYNLSITILKNKLDRWTSLQKARLSLSPSYHKFYTCHNISLYLLSLIQTCSGLVLQPLCIGMYVHMYVGLSRHEYVEHFSEALKLQPLPGAFIFADSELRHFSTSCAEALHGQWHAIVCAGTRAPNPLIGLLPILVFNLCSYWLDEEFPDTQREQMCRYVCMHCMHCTNKKATRNGKRRHLRRVCLICNNCNIPLMRRLA